MTWFKVDDSFSDHPKMFDAPDCAVALWTRAGSWAARNLTDGFVPSKMPVRLCDDPEKAVQELVDRRMWKRVKGGYQFHDWDDYQPTREAVEKDRAAARERMKKLRSSRSNPDSFEGSSADVRPNKSRTSPEVRDPRPDPTREPPTEVPSSPPQVSKPKKATRIPEQFTVTEDMVDWARENTPDVDGRTETAKFIDYWTAKSGRDAAKLDWIATWRNWMRNAQERTGARASSPSNVIALREDRPPRQSTSDQRMATALELAAKYRKEETS